MGGFNSSRWHYHRKKYTVEECRSFDLSSLAFAHYFEADNIHTRQYKWTCRGEPSGNMGVIFFPQSRIEFRYTVTFAHGRQAQMKQAIPISSSALNFGGKRYWLHCPICNRRTCTLHMPPTDHRFACRQCHDLTYISAQEAHQYDRGVLAGIMNSYKLIEAIYQLEEKLSKCRGKSKNRRRYLTKIAHLENQLTSSQTAQDDMFMQDMVSDLELLTPEVPQATDEADLGALLESINQGTDELLARLNTDFDLPDME